MNWIENVDHPMLLLLWHNIIHFISNCVILWFWRCALSFHQSAQGRPREALSTAHQAKWGGEHKLTQNVLGKLHRATFQPRGFLSWYRAGRVKRKRPFLCVAFCIKARSPRRGPAQSPASLRRCSLPKQPSVFFTLWESACPSAVPPKLMRGKCWERKRSD